MENLEIGNPSIPNYYQSSVGLPEVNKEMLAILAVISLIAIGVYIKRQNEKYENR